MKARIEVMYHKQAHRETVDRLVAEHAATLMAGIDANRERGRSEQAYLFSDGHVLSAGSRHHAEKQGLKLPKNTEYVIVGIPEDCETAQFIRDHLNADPNSALIDVNDLE